jgi:hypothetical protein
MPFILPKQGPVLRSDVHIVLNVRAIVETLVWQLELLGTLAMQLGVLVRRHSVGIFFDRSLFRCDEGMTHVEERRGVAAMAGVAVAVAD